MWDKHTHTQPTFQAVPSTLARRSYSNVHTDPFVSSYVRYSVANISHCTHCAVSPPRMLDRPGAGSEDKYVVIMVQERV
jgi:hypothetical protein